MTLSSLWAAKCRGLSEGVWGLAPGNCGCLPQQGCPLKRPPCTPPKLFTRRWAGEQAQPVLAKRVLSMRKSQGVRVVLPCGNLHPQVCPPLTFSPLSVTVVTMVTVFGIPPPLSKTSSRPSPSSRLERQLHPPSGMSAGVLIGDVVLVHEPVSVDIQSQGQGVGLQLQACQGYKL